MSCLQVVEFSDTHPKWGEFINVWFQVVEIHRRLHISVHGIYFFKLPT